MFVIENRKHEMHVGEEDTNSTSTKKRDPGFIIRMSGSLITSCISRVELARHPKNYVIKQVPVSIECFYVLIGSNK